MSNIFQSASPIRVGNFASAPADVSAGSLYWDTTSGALKVSNGSSYVSLHTGTTGIATGGTGQTTQTAAFDALSPTTTKGDLIVNDGTNNVRRAVGTNGQFLQADSTQATGVKWAASTGITALIQDPTPTLGGPFDMAGQRQLATGPFITGAGSGFFFTDTVANALFSKGYNSIPTPTSFDLLANQTAANTGVLDVPGSSQKGTKIDYMIYDTTSKNRRIGTLYVVQNNDVGTNADPTGTAIMDVSTETGDVGVTWTANFSGNTLHILYTSGAGGKKMSCIQMLYSTDH